MSCDDYIELNSKWELFGDLSIETIAREEYIGARDNAYQGQKWHFVHRKVSRLLDHWTHHTLDDHGLDF